MRVIYFIILFLAAGALASSAETNAGTNAGSAVPAKNNSPMGTRPQGPIHIHADGQTDFDANTYWVTYQDNVKVSDPQMKMTCEWLTANLPRRSIDHITNIVAQTNVVVDFKDDSGRKTHVTGDKAVYVFQVLDGRTNETITLTADAPRKPTIQRGLDNMTGDSIVWDRVANHVYVRGFEGEGWPSTNTPSGTNSAAQNKNSTFIP